MSKETRRFFSTFSTRNFESFRRERLPVWRRTRTTQEKLISEFYEVTGPTGPARAKGDICVHKEVGVHNGNPLLVCFVGMAQKFPTLEFGLCKLQ